MPRLLSFYAEYKAIMPKKVLISWPLVNMRPTCNNKILVYWFTIFRENEKKTLLKLINASVVPKKLVQNLTSRYKVTKFPLFFSFSQESLLPVMDY